MAAAASRHHRNRCSCSGHLSRHIPGTREASRGKGGGRCVPLSSHSPRDAAKNGYSLLGCDMYRGLGICGCSVLGRGAGRGGGGEKRGAL
eukprot:scaffold5006_cov116-Isochrysis_galbana.AAC.4